MSTGSRELNQRGFDELSEATADLTSVKQKFTKLINATGALLATAEEPDTVKTRSIFVGKKELLAVRKALRGCGEVGKRPGIKAKSARSRPRKRNPRGGKDYWF